MWQYSKQDDNILVNNLWKSISLFSLCNFFLLRFSLAFLDAGTINGNESFVEGSSFQDGYNMGIGVYGTNNITIENNVIYHTVGPGIDLQGNNNKLLRNLVIYSIAEATYKVLFWWLKHTMIFMVFSGVTSMWLVFRTINKTVNTDITF